MTRERLHRLLLWELLDVAWCVPPALVMLSSSEFSFVFFCRTLVLAGLWGAVLPILRTGLFGLRRPKD